MTLKTRHPEYFKISQLLWLLAHKSPCYMPRNKIRTVSYPADEEDTIPSLLLWQEKPSKQRICLPFYRLARKVQGFSRNRTGVRRLCEKICNIWVWIFPVSLPALLAHHTPTIHHVMTFHGLTWNFLHTEACYSESSGIHWWETSYHRQTEKLWGLFLQHTPR